ncbi:beta-ketoacyl synthase chain length factor [Tahibacter amnicola]|uniref:Beta-ketoacyl synthase chain length factor n=1 Tax=Tahibacter amnicola TaxID=2976241 RepID=A0ABY6BFP9_9GAMM|nr:beta-ketoacyl synthase chain length factor [Tahibacter amnicola]UXI68699.1 beta-ketoacyl synthase chain length factor [Tahibacter amnicola]
MSLACHLRVSGVGLCGPGLPGWPASIDALRGAAEPDERILQRPAPPLLPAAERRRAPDSVLYAAQAASEACAMAGADPALLPCIFGSSQGDIAITDYMCATLASAPLELSPTKFHNSVHNAAVGYWSIATGCRAPSTALSAWSDTFGAALLEAACQAVDNEDAVLLAVYDTPSAGPMKPVIPYDIGFAMALVLTPDRPGADGTRLVLERCQDEAHATVPATDWARRYQQRSGAAASLPFLEALAGHANRRVVVGAGPGLSLAVEVSP